MKKSLIFFTVLLLSSITPQAHSFRNICEEAAKGLTETYVTFNQYFDSYLKNHNAEGRSKVRDVFPTSDSNAYLVVIDCGNDVLLRTVSRSGFLRDLKVGQTVSFSGNIQGWSKRFYQNSDRYYIEITLSDGSSISY